MGLRLSYVRSRRYTERIDGVLVTDPTGDLGRVQRQQRFLAAVMSELGATRNPSPSSAQWGRSAITSPSMKGSASWRQPGWA